MNCIKCNEEHNGKYGSGKYCSRQCANSRSWSKSDKDKKSISAINSPLVLKANQNKRIGCTTEKLCPICSSKFIVPNSEITKIFCSRECYNLDVNFKFKKKSPGGYRAGSGRSKSGWYKNIWCDSSWELAWVIYQLDHKIYFNRNHKGFDYIFNNNKHKYYPDFKTKDSFIEIKGRLTDKDKHKINQFPSKLKVLFRRDLKNVFNYVIKKYGGDFIKLYENNPHKIRNNKCEICNKPAKNKYCSRKCTGIAVGKSTADGHRTHLTY